ATIEAGREMIDLEERRGHLAAVGDAPDERVEINVQRAGGTTAVIKVASAETNDGAECLFPGKGGEINGNIGIGSECGAIGTGSILILIDLESTREAGAIVTQMPAGGIAIGGAREGASAENEQIATTVEKIRYGGPCRFGNGGDLRED